MTDFSYFHLDTLYHQDIPRYVNPHDPMVKAIERERWTILCSGVRIAYNKTNLIGALVRYEPAFQHEDHSGDYGHLERDILGALGTVISGEYTPPNPPTRGRKDFRFTNILWHGFGYSRDMSQPGRAGLPPNPDWLTKNIRVVGLAGDEDEAR